MINTHKLQDHMSSLPLFMSCGLPTSVRCIFLVSTVEDIAAAAEYLLMYGQDIKIVGAYIPDMKKTASGTVSIGGKNVPMLPLKAVKSHPEARILLYSSSYFEFPLKKNSGLSLAGDIIQHAASFSLAPDVDHTAWYARRSPELYSMHKKDLEDSYSLLADEDSKAAFAAAVKTLVTGELGYLRPAPFAQYAHHATMIRPGDYVIDGGMHSLDDAKALAKAAMPGGVIFSFEPEPSQFQKIQKDVIASPVPLNIQVFPLALGAEDGECHIVPNDAGSWLTRKPKGNSVACKICSVDSFVRQQNISKIDVIKFDIEGCELDGLLGAEQTIRTHKPRLMISAYHKPEDLFTLTKLLIEFVPKYKFFFSCHYMFAGEFVFYISL